MPTLSPPVRFVTLQSPALRRLLGRLTIKYWHPNGFLSPPRSLSPLVVPAVSDFYVSCSRLFLLRFVVPLPTLLNVRVEAVPVSFFTWVRDWKCDMLLGFGLSLFFTPLPCAETSQPPPFVNCLSFASLFFVKLFFCPESTVFLTEKFFSLFPSPVPHFFSNPLRLLGRSGPSLSFCLCCLSSVILFLNVLSVELHFCVRLV